MSRIELIGGLIGGGVSILGLVDSFHGFLAAGLTLKLLVVGIAGIISTVLLTLRLTNGNKPGSILSGAAALLLTCGIFVVVALLLATKSPIVLREQIANGKSTATLVAAYSSANAITIQFPGHGTAICTWTDDVPESFPRLDAQIVDWDSAVPKLHIDNFINPQRITIECRPPTPLRGIIVDPPSTDMFLDPQLKRWLTWILFLGGMIWLAACCRLWVSSRLA